MLEPAMSIRLSIITPTLNAMKFFKETADSVAKLGIDYEWIIIDGGSDDGTSEYIDDLVSTSPSIRKLAMSQPNLHPWLRCQEALPFARGDYVLVLDADDVLGSGAAVAKAISVLDQHPETYVAVTLVAYMDEKGKVYKVKRIPFVQYNSIMPRRRMFWTLFLSPTYPLKQGAVLIRRSLYSKTGSLFDIDLILEATRYTDFALIGEIGLKYRNVSSSQSALQRHRIKDKFWINFANRYLPNDQYYGLKYAFSAYKIFLGFIKILYSKITPNRI